MLDNSYENQHERKLSNADRITMLRRAKMRRARELDKESLELQRVAELDEIIRKGRQAAAEAIQRAERQIVPALLDASKTSVMLTKGPSLHAGTYRNVSEVQDYLNSFRSDFGNDEMDDLQPPAFLFSQEDARNVPAQDDSDLDDTGESQGGIFGLTQAMASPGSGPAVPSTQGLGHFAGGDELAQASNDSRLEIAREGQQHTQSLDASKAPAYSNQGKSYRKFRRLEMERVHKPSAVARGPAATAPDTRVPRIGRTPHLPENTKLIAIEFDILKEISVREELVNISRKCFVRLVDTVEILRDLRLKIDEMRFTRRQIPPAIDANAGKKNDSPKLDPRMVKRQLIATLVAQKQRLIEMQTELRGELVRLRASTSKVASAIQQWRKAVRAEENRLELDASFPIFDWFGVNYLVKMQTDMSFLDGKTDPRVERDEHGKSLTARRGVKQKMTRASLKQDSCVSLKALEDKSKSSSRQLQYTASIAFETPAHTLVGKWIGFAPEGNPLLLPPKGHDPLADLERWTKLEDERQVAQRQADMRKQIFFGLQTGKTALEIFEAVSGDSRHAPASEQSRGAVMTSFRAGAGRRGLTIVIHRSPSDSTQDDVDKSRPLSARGYHDPERPRFSGLGRFLVSPRFQLDHADDDDDDDDDVDDEASAFSAIASEIVKESAAIEEWKLEKAREQQRKLQAYDPVANTVARGGRDEALDRYLAKQAEPEDRESLRKRAEDTSERETSQPTVQGGTLTTDTIASDAKTKTRSELGSVDLEEQHLLRTRGFTRNPEVRRAISRIDTSAVEANRAERMRLERELSHLGPARPSMTPEQAQARKELELKLSILRSGVSSKVFNRRLLDLDESEVRAAAQAQAQAERAATRVQSIARMHLGRKSYLDLLDDEKYLQKLSQEEMMERSVEDVAATMIQMHFRGFFCRKECQLREATRLMNEEAERKAREETMQEELERRKVEEIRERGRQRRLELAQAKEARAKQDALDAAEKAQAARTISRSIKLHVDHSRQKQLALRKLQETRQDKAAIVIQAQTRGLLVRLHAATLHARERQRRRGEEARRHAREEYAQLYASTPRDENDQK
ncbi:Hypothetical Protein FCC1311_070302 [Hondaea fermentalgiana]|uniref:Uncharacterized protein n=1 Tax=Hondaea fermentalgiana TaxID=2315210 RepID=A0A2R5GIU1_9STRA|nr:Hypothetical Protein FCC1311_070302 [Hondaea fermentalgiana]|eukprot:GBG30810.1 Hypothetical Protein FCC1311_070302 [Hondaea fermentalgiana]